MYFASINRQAERFCQFHRLRPETLAGMVRQARLSSWPTDGDADKAAIDRLFIRLPLAWEKQELAEQLRNYPFLSALSGQILEHPRGDVFSGSRNCWRFSEVVLLLRVGTIGHKAPRTRYH